MKIFLTLFSINNIIQWFKKKRKTPTTSYIFLHETIRKNFVKKNCQSQ